MTTKHTCGGPVFGHKTPGCSRCDELINGASPVQWQFKSRRSALNLASTHNCAQSNCGTVCTFGDW